MRELVTGRSICKEQEKRLTEFICNLNLVKHMLSFLADYFDPHPQVLKKFLLKYYPESHEVEMKEINTGRKFLSKTKLDGSLSLDDFFVGSVVVIFARDLKLVDYGDNETRSALSEMSEVGAIFIAPSFASMAETVIQDIEFKGMILSNLKTFRLDASDVTDAAKLLQGDPDVLCKNNGETDMNYCIYMEFRGKNAAAASTAIIESHGIKGLIAASSNAQLESFKRHFLFKAHEPIARYEVAPESSCCVIKPHAIKSRVVGQILKDIKEGGFQITAMQVFHMDRSQATEFYEVYSGIKEYHKMVEELISGPVLAMEINAHCNDFRMKAGPWDVELAKALYPNTIRARFGNTTVQNAIHCTDLEKEGTNELSYFFDILAAEAEKSAV